MCAVHRPTSESTENVYRQFATPPESLRAATGRKQKPKTIPASKDNMFVFDRTLMMSPTIRKFVLHRMFMMSPTMRSEG